MVTVETARADRIRSAQHAEAHRGQQRDVAARDGDHVIRAGLLQPPLDVVGEPGAVADQDRGDDRGGLGRARRDEPGRRRARTRRRSAGGRTRTTTRPRSTSTSAALLIDPPSANGPPQRLARRRRPAEVRAAAAAAAASPVREWAALRPVRDAAWRQSLRRRTPAAVRERRVHTPSLHGIDVDRKPDAGRRRNGVGRQRARDQRRALVATPATRGVVEPREQRGRDRAVTRGSRPTPSCRRERETAQAATREPRVHRQTERRRGNR